MRKIAAGLTLLGALLLVAPVAAATLPSIITVDGVEYEATKVSGPTVHFETPDTNPVAAFTERNTWTGNGSEHLPCENGIHWIDNANVLTISHCLDGPEPTTTTTVPEETTTTVVETTTTVPEETTTTTVVETTTTVPETTTTVPVTTTTTQPPELPYTGPEDIWLAGLGVLLLAAGGTMLKVGGRPE